MDAREIDLWMRHIWLKIVRKEYDRSRILEESNLSKKSGAKLNNTLCGSANLERFLRNWRPGGTQ